MSTNITTQCMANLQNAETMLLRDGACTAAEAWLITNKSSRPERRLSVGVGARRCDALGREKPRREEGRRLPPLTASRLLMCVGWLLTSLDEVAWQGIDLQGACKVMPLAHGVMQRLGLPWPAVLRGSASSREPSLG